MTIQFRRICVGTATRNRPIMLQALLDSYAAMTIPANTQLHFIIVENNAIPTLSEIIARFRANVPNCTVQYEIETDLGIAQVRNRTLECAIEAGADYLTFADDDEVVDSHWLTSLLAERDAFDLDLVGSPVRFAPLSGASRWQRMVWRGLNQRTIKSERKAIWRKANGEAGKILVATGSWLGRLDFFRHTGLRFDNSLGLSGGEDTRLYQQARQIGARTGWTQHALAYETVPLERLTLLYQYIRSRDDSVVVVREKLKRSRFAALYRLPGSLAVRLLKLAILVISVPLTGGASMVRAAACVGSIMGILLVFTGKRTSHYGVTTGA